VSAKMTLVFYMSDLFNKLM